MKKKDKKNLMYVGIAAVAGFAGWKYYQSKKVTPASAVTPPPAAKI